MTIELTIILLASPFLLLLLLILILNWSIPTVAQELNELDKERLFIEMGGLFINPERYRK